MSRSYKKHPSFVCRLRSGKAYANRRIRHNPIDVDIADGGTYKKFYEQWDIVDWHHVIYSYSEWLDYFERINFDNEKEVYQCYYNAITK